MYCLLILLTTIVASYGSVTEIMDQGFSFKEGGLFIIAFYCMALLYVICNEAHHASRKMGPEFKERLLNVKLNAVDQRTRLEVYMFLTAIDKNPPIMNLNGYVNVNRKLIWSVSGLIVWGCSRFYCTKSAICIYFTYCSHDHYRNSVN